MSPRRGDIGVILHEDLEVLLDLKARTEAWLAERGLNLKPSKTRITHTLHEHDGNVGFDFLGFTVRQFPTGRHRSRQGFKTIIKPSKEAQRRHLSKMAEVIRTHRGSNQTALLTALNPKIRGWSNYYRPCAAKPVLSLSKGRSLTAGRATAPPTIIRRRGRPATDHRRC